MPPYRGRQGGGEGEAKMGRKQLFRLALLILGIVLVINILIFLNLNKDLVDNELIALDLLPKPETMTELYFTNNTNLPNAVENNQPINFTFVIHNLEATDYQYTYNVSVITNGNKRIVDSGKVLIKDDQYYIKNENFTVTHSPGRQEVVVELISKQQSIDFWIGGAK